MPCPLCDFFSELKCVCVCVEFVYGTRTQREKSQHLEIKKTFTLKFKVQMRTPSGNGKRNGMNILLKKTLKKPLNLV